MSSSEDETILDYKGPNLMTGIPIRRGHLNTDRGRMPCDYRARDWVVSQPAKGCQRFQSPEAERVVEQILCLSPEEGTNTADSLIWDFWPPELLRIISLVISHPVNGTLLWQP